MYIQNNSWKRMYRDCAKTVSQIRPKESIRCNSSLCAVKDSMLSLDKYFGKETGSLAEVRFLVENVDVMITGILELNNSCYPQIQSLKRFGFRTSGSLCSQSNFSQR